MLFIYVLKKKRHSRLAGPDFDDNSLYYNTTGPKGQITTLCRDNSLTQARAQGDKLLHFPDPTIPGQGTGD